MRTLADTLREVIERNPFLQTGLGQGIFNLSKLAAFLRPELEVRTKKELSTSSIVMQLSRLSRSKSFVGREEEEIQLDTITVYSNLLALTFNKDVLSEKVFERLHRRIGKGGGFFTLSEGAHQLTFIVEQRHQDWIIKLIGTQPSYMRPGVSALALSFSERYLNVPGLFYRLCQPLYFQNINVIEVSSTATEFVVFIETTHVQLAFDTLFSRFMPKNRG